MFEPIDGYDWVNTDIIIDDTIIEDVFDTFDLYNFTVREDEPLEKEVAVDPEMLGKVFENLLEVKDKKSKGAFYTPREIVHYMCQESLINYLDTSLNTIQRPIANAKAQQSSLFGDEPAQQEQMYEDVYEEKIPKSDIAEFIHMGDLVQEHDAEIARKERETDTYQFKLPESIRKNSRLIDDKLTSVKVCDPAIGSGAFPVGMMSEIVRARLALNAYLGDNGRASYDFKRQALQESIYGVDIDSSAVDIAKLRLWLSLVVDEVDFATIKPLPNLDYKIMVGNSLLGVKLDLLNQHLFQRLRELKESYFDETRKSVKEHLKQDINTTIGKVMRGEHDFEYRAHFSEVFAQQQGFDIVIGNPPYVSTNDMKELSKKYRKLYITAYGSYDIYVLFFEKAQDILRKNGTLCFITSNKWIIADYGCKLREMLLNQMRLLRLIDLADCNRVFQGALVSPIISIVSNNNKPSEYAIPVSILKGTQISKFPKHSLLYKAVYRNMWR